MQNMYEWHENSKYNFHIVSTKLENSWNQVPQYHYVLMETLISRNFWEKTKTVSLLCDFPMEITETYIPTAFWQNFREINVIASRGRASLKM